MPGLYYTPLTVSVKYPHATATSAVTGTAQPKASNNYSSLTPVQPIGMPMNKQHPLSHGQV